ncbi:hypothetical protein AB6A40_009458 [Gnathostoma spinigerum]|uniref:Chondroitin proteoglycan 3 n=1 Tax=Gnathostoma spinigerum TaxID=75299 RepID=A0ABD6EX63_9BILA
MSSAIILLILVVSSTGIQQYHEHPHSYSREHRHSYSREHPYSREHYEHYHYSKINVSLTHVHDLSMEHSSEELLNHTRYHGVTVRADDAKKCTPAAECYNDAECNGGVCLGFFLQTCNCNACVTFTQCKSDSECGGLKGACNTTNSFCDCNQGFVENGYTSSFDALFRFCNIQKCGSSNDTCLGLPCNKGTCLC